MPAAAQRVRGGLAAVAAITRLTGRAVTAVAVSGPAGEMATVLGNLGDPFGDIGRLVAVLCAHRLRRHLPTCTRPALACLGHITPR